MKIAHLIAAATMVAGLGVSTAATAQDYGHNDHYERRIERHEDRRHYGWDRGRHNGWNNHRNCHTEWRHHRRVTVCYR